MYPLLEPLTRDIACRLDQFVAAGMTGISATIAKMKPPVFPQLSRRDDCDKHLSGFQPLSNYKR